MKTITTDVFFELLQQSDLLTSDRMAEVHTWQERHPGKLAAELVGRGWITHWQAQQLLWGRHQFHLGQYRLLQKLGEGGMGAVYKAYQYRLGRTVALKMISDRFVERADSVARFQREAQAMAALSHPNIVTAYDADLIEGTHMLVMEYVEGHGLNVWLDAFGRLPLDWSCECIRQAALGLQHAHERGLIHRDLKPSNLLVTTEHEDERLPWIKILDLGLARSVRDSDQTSLTGTGFVIGTPDYMSPEQGETPKDIDIRSDIYSLGVTLFELLSGELPFQGETAVQKLLLRASEDAPRVRSLREDIPADLDAILAKMLARKPADRFQTPADLADALIPFALSSLPEEDRELPELPSRRAMLQCLDEGGETTLHEVPASSEYGSRDHTQLAGIDENAPANSAAVTDVLRSAAGMDLTAQEEQLVGDVDKRFRIAVLYDSSFLLRHPELMPYESPFADAHTFHIVPQEVKQQLRSLKRDARHQPDLEHCKQALISLMDTGPHCDYCELRLEEVASPVTCDNALGTDTWVGQLLVGYAKASLERGNFTHIILATDDGGITLDVKKLRQDFGLPVYAWGSFEAIEYLPPYEEVREFHAHSQQQSRRLRSSLMLTFGMFFLLAGSMIAYLTFQEYPWTTVIVGSIVLLLFGPAAVEIWLQQKEAGM